MSARQAWPRLSPDARQMVRDLLDAWDGAADTSRIAIEVNGRWYGEPGEYRSVVAWPEPQL